MDEFNQFQPKEGIQGEVVKSQQSMPKPPSKSKKSLLIVLIIIVVAVILVGSFFVMRAKKQQVEQTSPLTVPAPQPVSFPEPTPQVSEEEIILNELESITNELNQINLPDVDNEFQSLDQDINQL